MRHVKRPRIPADAPVSAVPCARRGSPCPSGGNPATRPRLLLSGDPAAPRSSTPPRVAYGRIEERHRSGRSGLPQPQTLVRPLRLTGAGRTFGAGTFVEALLWRT